MAAKKNEPQEAAAIETTEPPVTYSREELQRAAVFADRRDLLAALIQEDEKLTLEQARTRIDDFNKRKVN